MRMGRRTRIAEQNGGAVGPQKRGLLRLPVVCVHEEDEQEPEPVRKKPIISVNGKDILPGPARSTNRLQNRKLA
jgi:hypothetical protein